MTNPKKVQKSLEKSVSEQTQKTLAETRSTKTITTEAFLTISSMFDLDPSKHKEHSIVVLNRFSLK